jgi:glycosyltransferase involved in cell wall biosynthesis
MSGVTWGILTGEYPPQPGGVADYTRLVARELAAAGERVIVWCPACAGPESTDPGVTVRRLPGRFGPHSLLCLNRELAEVRPPVRLLVQYVPHAFGWKAMNLPFCLWLRTRRREEVWIMFHEVSYPLGPHQPWKHNLLGRITRLMAGLTARGADRVFVSIPAWATVLRQLAPQAPPAQWLPVPSNLPTRADPEAVALARRQASPDLHSMVIGHFGTFGAHVTIDLRAVIVQVLTRDRRRRALLLGRGSDVFAAELERAEPSLAGRLTAPGSLPAEEVVAHLAACDVLVQPYPDGVSSRRGSVMAGLALGLPIVTTNGELTEPLWRRTQAVLLAQAADVPGLVRLTEKVLDDGGRRAALGAEGARLYRQWFDVARVTEVLLGPTAGVRTGAEACCVPAGF